MDSKKKSLKGKRIAIIAADGFEYVELAVPKAALDLAGADVEVISLHGGKIRGMNLTEPTRTVRVDRTFDEADPDTYDALFVPGGLYGPDFCGKARRPATSSARSTSPTSPSRPSATAPGCSFQPSSPLGECFLRGRAFATTSCTPVAPGAIRPLFTMATGCRAAARKTCASSFRPCSSTMQRRRSRHASRSQDPRRQSSHRRNPKRRSVWP